MPESSASVVFQEPLPRLLEGVITLRKISSGAYGTVFLGRDSARRELAVKAVSPQIPAEAQERERCGLECYLEKFQCGGDHLLAIHQISPSGEPLRYSMELADNLNDPNTSDDYCAASLEAWVERNGALPVRQIVDFMHQLLDGVSELHGKGLLHRDLKPGNIYFVRGRLKIGDLGLVTSFRTDNALIGTREFIPQGISCASTEMDVYALGKILYTMFTGLSAGEFPRIPEKLMKDASVRALNEFILEHACSESNERRFQNAEDFREAFDAVSNPAERQRRIQKRLRSCMIGGQIVFVAAILLWAWSVSWKKSAPKSIWPEGYGELHQAWYERIPPTDSTMRYKFGRMDCGAAGISATVSSDDRIVSENFEMYIEATCNVGRANFVVEFLDSTKIVVDRVRCVLTPRGVFSETTVLDGTPNGDVTWGIRLLPIDGTLMLLANGRPVLDASMPHEGPPWFVRFSLESESAEAADGRVKLGRFCVFEAVP